VKPRVATVLADPGVSLPEAAVLRADPTSDSEWDRDLAACEGATFFHGSSWARVLKDTYGYRPAYFAVRQPGRIRSLLPIMDVDSWLTGSRGVCLPFADECAPLCHDSDSFRVLYREALDFGKSRRWRYIECRGGLQFFDGARPSVSFLGHRLDLRGGEDALSVRCDSSVRRAIRKAQQSGLSVEFSRDLDAVRAFHKLLCKTRRRLGVPPQPFAFFANIHRHVLAQEQGWVVLARQRQVPVAGAVYLQSGRTAIFKFGASDEAYQDLRANNLVMWEAIKHYAGRGFEVLDFGRTSHTNGGLRKFKLSWGTDERRIEYVRHDCRTGAFAVVNDASSGLHTRMFRMLPEPVSRLAGAVLYRHMA
jgi:CelD/BcsL family acetyltransferase involved in cellulose biosynthesis